MIIKDFATDAEAYYKVEIIIELADTIAQIIK